MILRLRQACSHPSLITGFSVDDDADALQVIPEDPSQAKGEDESDELADLLGGLAVTAKKPLCALCSREAIEGTLHCLDCKTTMAKFKGFAFSTKVWKLLEILRKEKEEDPKRKTIVFSQFTSFFNVLEPFLKEAGFRYVRFDGKMPPPKRAESLEKIRNDPKTTIILISIKTGSVGLNLTCCCRVILCDLWWNPAIENQAFDRAHRMGQQHDVKIYKLCVENTIEDRILELQTKKAELAAACLGRGEFKKANKLSLGDIMHLFSRDTDES